MKSLSRLMSLTRNLVRKETVEKDLDREVRSLLDLLIDEKIEAGLGPDEARRQALVEMGGPEQLKERVRIDRTGSRLEELAQDIRYGLRMLIKNPGLAIAAAITLALAVGANTAVFSAVNAVLLRPFPYPEPERLGMVYTFSPRMGLFWSSEPDVQDLRDKSSLFEGFGAIRYGSSTLLGGKAPQRLSVGLMSANVFPLLRVQPQLGRPFTPDQEKVGGPRVGIISHQLWEHRFGADPDVIDKMLEFDGSEPVRVIGVMPPGFRLIVPRHTNFPTKIDFWYPYQVDYYKASRGNKNLTVLTRLKEGVSWGRARDELDRIAESMTGEVRSTSFRLLPLHADTVNESSPALLTLLLASGFILLIACANVANLLLAQGATRSREVAIRTALGATRLRLVRQALTESFLMASLGGLAGIGLAWAAIGGLSSYLPSQLPRLESIELNGTVLAVSLATTILAGLLFGLAPALRPRARNLGFALKEGGRGRAGAGIPRFMRNTLVVAEIALSLMLLVTGSLIVRSFLSLQGANPGFNPSNTLTFTVTIPSRRYAEPEDRNNFFKTLQIRLAALPGVESVGGNLLLPFGRSLFMPTFTFYQPSDSSGNETQTLTALARPTLPGYFHTLESRLLEGRFFTDNDTSESKKVAVVDETLARRVWPGESAIGKRLARGSNPDSPVYRTVVGVVENLRLTSLKGERRRQVYLPIEQFSVPTLSYVVRTHIEPSAVLAGIQDQVKAMDPNLAIYELGRLDRTLSDAMARERLSSLLMTLFALIGVTLALVGVYGVISYTTSQDTHQIGIRFALGAKRTHIYGFTLARGLRPAAIGLVIGLAGAWVLGRAIEGQLFGVSSDDLVSFTALPAFLALASLLACYLPARRAARVDPNVALRCD